MRLEERVPSLILCWFAFAATAVHAQQCDPPAESLLPTPAAPPPAADETDTPIEITAGKVEVTGADSTEFSNQVEFRRGQRSISAERATYDGAGQRVQVFGRVTYRDPELRVYGEDAEVDTENQSISFSRAGFEMPLRPARGEASEITITSEALVKLADVSFTTCPGERPDWQLRASRISLDIAHGFGTARAVKLKFKGVPILYSPYVTFPIDDRRKSGFLTPSFANRDRTGYDIAAPYYLNLAPNYDMTIEPRYLSKRGLQANTEFRYLLPASSGQINLEYLPSDDAAGGRTRRYVNLRHESNFSDSLELRAGIADVSDDAYFEDLGTSLAITSQTHLNRYVDLTYYGPRWSLLSRVQDYQTIDPFLDETEQPYQRLPQILYNGRWSGHHLGFTSRAELVDFERDVGVTGWRLDSTQELSMRFERGGAFVSPAVALRQTNYWLDHVDAGSPKTPSRTLPVTSIDSGLRFERNLAHNASIVQTLEPRVLYVHVPYEDQSELPVFDTVEPDFSMVQLFRKYQFVGPDRITDSERVSVGVTTRLLDARTGGERLTATLGQTRYLTTQRVSLPDRPPNDANASDYIAELGVRLRDAWNLDVGYQWNTTTNTTTRAETRLEFRPQADRLFGFGYRYRQDLLEQGDLSLVWPATAHWRVIGRYSYSFLDHEPLERFLGWEYQSDCWRLRLVGRNYISSRTGESDSSLLVQLELIGLTQRDRSPEELLDRGILGYRSLGTSQLQ